MLHAFSRSEELLGREGLQKLANSRIAVFGIGGVGSYVVEALARAGVGSLTLVDHDEVNLTNLNRQWQAWKCCFPQRWWQRKNGKSRRWKSEAAAKDRYRAASPLCQVRRG